MTTRLDLRSPHLDDHLLREELGDLDRLWLRAPVPREVKRRLLEAAAATAAADGELSDGERRALLLWAHRFGLHPDDVAALRTFDPTGRPLGESLDGALAGLPRVLLYVGASVARADDLHRLERGALATAARRLGVEPAELRGIDALLAVEDAVHEGRRRLVAAPPPQAAGPQVDGGSPMRAHVFGPGAGGPLLRDFAVKSGKAVLLVAAGDGEISEREFAWFLGERRALGTPPDVLEELLKLDVRAERLEDVVDDTLRPHVRGVLYSAVRTSSADGFGEAERRAAEAAAMRLGLDVGFVAAIETQVRTEDALRRAKTALLAPR